MKRINQGKLIILGLLLAAAVYLRFYNLTNTVLFLGDQGRDAIIVADIFRQKDLVFIGPVTSVGNLYLGPLYYYFMLPFLWLWRLDPTGPAVMVALFGTATVYVVYRIGRDFFNERVGLAASALYALSPVVIAFSRSSWTRAR